MAVIIGVLLVIATIIFLVNPDDAKSAQPSGQYADYHTGYVPGLSPSFLPIIVDTIPILSPVRNTRPKVPTINISVNRKTLNPHAITVSNKAHAVRGMASWYCLRGISICPYSHSSGMYAAAGPALRVGDWRGRVIQVCTSRCINVTLVDWCACPNRVIDLFGDAFRRLAPLSTGIVPVTVRW